MDILSDVRPTLDDDVTMACDGAAVMIVATSGFDVDIDVTTGSDVDDIKPTVATMSVATYEVPDISSVCMGVFRVAVFVVFLVGFTKGFNVFGREGIFFPGVLVA